MAWTESSVAAGDQSALGSGLAALAAAGVAIALTVFAGALEVSGGPDPGWEVAAQSLVVAVTVGVGLSIVLLRPGNLVGWFLLGSGLLLSLEAIAGPYAYRGLVSDPGSLPAARWAALWNEAGWPSLYAGVTAVAFVFPDGRLPSQRWRNLAMGVLGAFVGLTCVLLVAPGRFGSPYQGVSSPLPRLPGSLGVLVLPFLLGTLTGLCAAAWAVRVRFRSAAGVERKQLLWFTYAALLIPLALAVCITEELAAGRLGAPTIVALMIAILAVPICVGIAVLRYQLFDIELVISRTLVYGVLTFLVVGLYAGAVGVLGELIGQRGASGLIAVGIVAVGFQPLRSRLQSRVNRLVYGDRWDPYAALTRLGERLQATLATSEVLQTIVDSVAEALRLSSVAIEFNRAGTVEVAAVSGPGGSRGSERIALSYQGEEVGWLAVSVPRGRQLSSADRRLLDDLAQHAGVAVHAARLTTDLQRSREQLVAAREEERLRLRRDLHDGLGPALAGMVLKLDAARGKLAQGDSANDLLSQLRGEAREAIEDIRRVVNELRPPALDELGLVEALREQAIRLCGPASEDRRGVSVRVEAPGSLPHLPAAVEVAAYRITMEAMTNVIRHANARNCTVRLALKGSLDLEVADDGRGIPDRPQTGVGLVSMRERAGELGGRLEIRRRPGGGTVIHAVLPVAGR